MFTKKRHLSDLILLCTFTVVTIAIGLSFLYYQTHSLWPDQASLTYWDAGWYHSIVQNGYQYNPTAANNTAFFPLFPYVWKILHVDAVGISAFNALMFIISSWLLFRSFPTHWRYKLLYLSFTLIVFYTTPMSESLFFLFSTLALIGLEKNKATLVIIGIIGASFCRSVSTVFFPAFTFIAIYRFLEKKNSVVTIPYMKYGLIALTILFIVFFIQYYQTGEFWAFYHTQHFWFAHFQLPDIPFSTWEPKENGYIDQLAVFIAFLSIIYLAALLMNIKRRSLPISDAHLFSLLYLGGTALLLLFTRGGGFNSANRYIFSTPFFFLFIRQIETFQFSKACVIGILVFGMVYYLVGWHMGVSVKQIIIFISVLTGVVLLVYSVKKNTRIAGAFLILFAILSLCIQGILWSRYVMNIWVG